MPTDGGELFVAGEEELQRFDVQGAPLDLGTVAVGFTRRLRVDDAAGFAYLAVGSAILPPGRLVVVDVAAMQIVAELDFLDLAPPHAFVTLRDGSLLRFRADGANTTLLSIHPTRGEPLDLVVGEDGRTVLLVKRDTDEVDVFVF